jgi:hypothetical protein
MYCEFSVLQLALDPIESHVHGLGSSDLVLLLANPSAVELSLVILVGCDCSRPNSLSICRMYAPSWSLWKRAPISASEAAAMTFFMILLSTYIAPLECWMSSGQCTCPSRNSRSLWTGLVARSGMMRHCGYRAACHFCEI